MNFKPHDYQSYAIDYIEQHPVAAVLLDMGLGKTVISLTAIADLLFDSFIQNRYHGGALQGHQAECGKRERPKKRISRVTVSDAELFTRLLYYGLAHLHLTLDEVWLMPFGLLLDLWECHKQYNGQATPAREHYIDDIIPERI